jgi:regulator of RNase E activity RraA
VPTLNSIMVKSGLGSIHMRGVKAVGAARRFVGTATTLRAVPMREDLRRKVAAGELPDLQARAFEQTSAGETLIIAASGDTRASVFGDIMTTYLQVKGAAGIVIDGSVSDPEAIASIDLPVFAGGSSALSAGTFLHFTEIDAPVGCDGVAVCAGDAVVGDGNGVVVIPRAFAAEVADAAFEREELEVFILDRIKGGARLIGTYPPDDATRAAYQDWRRARASN